MEYKLYRSLRLQEKRLANVNVIPSAFPHVQKPAPTLVLVAGNVVISVNYFKRMIAWLNRLLGGHLKSYETLVERGRREAVVRMKQQASVIGGTMVFNVKISTSCISKGYMDGVSSLEILAYGTALIPTVKIKNIASFCGTGTHPFQLGN